MSASLWGHVPVPLFRRWQRAMERSRQRPVRGLGLTAVALEPPIEGLLPLERLLLVTLQPNPSAGAPALRLTGFCGRRVPFGVAFGGDGGQVFAADLRALPGSCPAAGLTPPSSRLVLQAALRLHERLVSPGPHHVRRFRLPRLWAGFRPEVQVTGDGPELLGRAHEAGLSQRELLQQSCRRHQELKLYPLDWTSHLWERAAAIYADVAQFPKYQAGRRIRLIERHGFRGACEFDLRPVGSLIAATAVPA